MDRRTFIKLSAASTVVLGVGGIGLTGCHPPLLEPDINGLRLIEGFTARIIAVSGQVVGTTGYPWPANPDGGACFPVAGGGWIYVANAETAAPGGGASMIRFSPTGEIVEAGAILAGTARNCAGGTTPWGTWLSCEEVSRGLVWECDPTGAAPAVARPLMGAFNHEAAAAHAASASVYLTEDRSDGAFYRFRPTTWGDLSTGTLEVLTEVGGSLAWATVPDPAATTTSTRYQVPGTRPFNGGEGTCLLGDAVVFTTKGDNRVWRYDPATNALTVIYDAATLTTPALTGVDNIAAKGTQLYVAEDGGDMQVVRIPASGDPYPVVQVTGVTGSEIAGVAFSPDGTRLYLSSQRNPGVTYEVTGAW